VNFEKAEKFRFVSIILQIKPIIVHLLKKVIIFAYKTVFIVTFLK